ncbi:SMC5-SMC6 complex component Non-SMC element 1 isoform X2 [Xylocopa sonorina]|uniref:SMC5-SMC6 complex component Non-SMC element 1 isoform X2 n=1 Tax=Xylocopa sonorina TaxID=1818115 RepID=UPI00403ADF18
MNSYNNQHKMLLQAIMHEGILKEDKVQELIVRLFNHDNLQTIINQINEQLQPLSMLIKKAQCEITGQIYWILVSTTLDEVTRFNTEFSKDQLTFLRMIFSEIIVDDDGCFPSTLCLNLCLTPYVNLSTAEANKFLDDVVNRKWLTYKDGHYYMGARTIAELIPYFRTTYEHDLRTCYLCKQVIFYGKKCETCQVRLHLYCLKRFIAVYNPPKCPNCNTVIIDIDLSEVNMTNVQLSNVRQSGGKKQDKSK